MRLVKAQEDDVRAFLRESTRLERITMRAFFADANQWPRSEAFTALLAKLETPALAVAEVQALELPCPSMDEAMDAIGATGIDLVSKGLRDWIDAFKATVIGNLTHTARKTLEGALKRALGTYVTVQDIAKELTDVLPLDPRGAQALSNYRSALQVGGYKPAQVRTKTAAYHDRLVQQRAAVIARTTVTQGLNAARLSEWADAQSKGYLAQDAEKVWIVTPDDKLCDQCRPLRGEKVPITSTFSAGVDMPPLHPNCRCTAGIA